MGPRARGDTLDKVRSDYIVFGDFVCHSPYVYCMTAYWVPLSKLIKDVTRAKTVDEIEIFEGNLQPGRASRGRDGRALIGGRGERLGCGLQYHGITVILPRKDPIPLPPASGIGSRAR